MHTVCMTREERYSPCRNGYTLEKLSIINPTSITEGKNSRKSRDDIVITPMVVIRASPTNLPNVPASVARKPEFHVPLWFGCRFETRDLGL